MDSLISYAPNSQNGPCSIHMRYAVPLAITDKISETYYIAIAKHFL